MSDQQAWSSTEGDVISTSSYDATSGLKETKVNLISVTGSVFSIIFYLIGVVGLLGNALVTIVMGWFSKGRKTPTIIYIINQAIIDAGAAMFLILGTATEVDDHMVDHVYDDVMDDVFCRVWVGKVPLWSLLISSTFNLLVLTLERFFAVVYPFTHRVAFNDVTVRVTLVFVWLGGLVIQLGTKVATSHIEGGVCYVMTRWPSKFVQRSVGAATILLQFFVPLVIILYCYIRMALVLKVKVKVGNVPAGDDVTGPRRDGGGDRMSERNMRARRNIFRTLASVSICFALCWIWNQTRFFLFNLGAFVPDFAGVSNQAAVIAVFMNCCLNPFIYAASYEHFRRGVRNLGRKLVGAAPSQPDDSVGNPGTSLAGR